MAVVANQIDIDYAAIAKEKSRNAEILKFAQTMANDHAAVIEQAAALAKKLGVTPKDNAVSKQLLEGAKQKQKELRALSRKAFDKAYIDNEVAYHEAVIGAVETLLIPETENGELKKLLKNVLPLANFVAGVYRYMKIAPGNYTCALLEGIGVDAVLMDYCRSNKDIDLICISTRGAGKFRKALGTNTGNLISHSATPVIAVPAGYRIKPIKTILYASDFTDWDSESKKVMEFAGELGLPGEAVHFQFNEKAPVKTGRNSSTAQLPNEYGWKIRITKPPAGHSLFQSLRTCLSSHRSSIAILFTNQGRSFLQRLFQPSRAERLAFEIRSPLLVFSKQSTCL